MKQECHKCGSVGTIDDKWYYSEKTEETICEDCYKKMFILKKRNFTLMKQDKTPSKKQNNSKEMDKKSTVFSELLSNSKKYSFNEYLKDKMNEE